MALDSVRCVSRRVVVSVAQLGMTDAKTFSLWAQTAHAELDDEAPNGAVSTKPYFGSETTSGQSQFQSSAQLGIFFFFSFLPSGHPWVRTLFANR